jgi:uncharacterized protein
VARFGALLRADGVGVTPAQTVRLVAAAAALPSTLTDLYWAARVTLVANRADLPAFDRAFAQVFRGLPDPALLGEDRGDPNAAPPVQRGAETGKRVMSAADTATSNRSGGMDIAPRPGDERETPDVVPVPTTASDVDRLSGIDFADLQPTELATIAALIRRLRLAPPLRRGRRSRRHPHGDRLDLRATLRHSPRTGGDPVHHIARRRVPRPRRLVVLCDISGSMEPYARAYVQFLHASTGAARAEVFTFATRLTRLTKALSGTQPQLALLRAAQAAPDWRGGTRIGAALKDFLDHYGRRGLARGAVVVILSDGWERADPQLLGEQMSRLHRLAHRVVWVNPRSADAGYAPAVGGMAAALPHCDAFLSGHNLDAFGHVLAAIAH